MAIAGDNILRHVVLLAEGELFGLSQHHFPS